MDTILVTAVGTAAGTAIIQELKKLSDVKVLGADINEPDNIVTSLEVDQYFVFPSVVNKPNDYYKFLREFCMEHGVDYLYCIIDEEVILLRENEKDLESIGVKLCLPNRSVVEICHYKNLFSNWIQTNAPEIFIEQYNELIEEDISFPVFVKPVEGRASIGCRKIENKTQLQEFFGLNNWKDFVIQKYVDAPIVAVDIVRDRKNNIINIAQRIERLRNSSGSGIAVEIIDDKKLEKICIELSEKLDLNGVINAEFFATEMGFKIIEINPRYPAGTKYSCMAGVNIVIDGLKIAKQQNIEAEKAQIGKKFAKRYDVYNMN